jgi:hypothetical protein
MSLETRFWEKPDTSSGPLDGLAKVLSMLAASLEECRDHISLSEPHKPEIVRAADKALQAFDEWRAR